MQECDLRFPDYPHSRRAWSTGAIAGLAGGLAEVVWIALYARLSGGDSTAVARGITESLFPGVGSALVAAPLGIAIHMALAIVLGIAIAAMLRTGLPRVHGTALEPVITIALLAGVWGVNFFLVLPVINPAFVALVPYSVSLISKMLFGFSAALVMHFLADRPRTQAG